MAGSLVARGFVPLHKYVDFVDWVNTCQVHVQRSALFSDVGCCYKKAVGEDLSERAVSVV